MSRWQSLTILSAGDSSPSPAPSHGVADGAGRRRFSSPLMVEVLAARRDGDAEDFHIARASPSIRAVSRMDVLLPAIIGQRARRRMRYPHSAKEDLRRINKAPHTPNSCNTSPRDKQTGKVLQSYRFSPLKTEVQMIDDWIYHTARASQNAVQIEYGIFSIIGKIVDKWEALLASSEVHLTKTMRKLLIAIVGAPVFSIASLAHATEASYTTVSNIITLLSSHGIITQVSRGRRNKVYAYPEALGLFDTIIAEVA